MKGLNWPSARWRGIALIAALIWLLVANDVGWASDHCDDTVAPGGNIQEAIDAAQPGDTICLGAGTYEDVAVEITVGITLEGAGPGTILRGPAGSSAATLRVDGAAGFTLRDLTIEDSGGHAIDVIGGSNILIENVTVGPFQGIGDPPAGLPGETWAEAIRLEDVDGATIRNVDLSQNDGFLGVNCGTHPDGGPGSTCTIEESDLTASWSAINVAGTTTVTITGNDIFDAGGRGIHVSSTWGEPVAVTANFNSITGNAIGVNNAAALTVDATNNWWGDASGPGDAGPGSGDDVTANVLFEPWCIDDQCAASSDEAVVFAFAGLTGRETGTEFEYAVTAQVVSPEAAGIDRETTMLRYRAQLTENGTPVAGQVATFPDAGDDPNDPATWSSITTDGTGHIEFGPASGFPLIALAELEDPGVTTPFRTSFVAAGTYTLRVWLYDVDSGEPDTPLGQPGEVTFTVTAPAPPPSNGFVAPPPAPDPDPETIETDGGVIVEVENQEEAETSATTETVVSTEGDQGSVEVTVPAGALPEGSTVLVAAVADLDDVVDQAPPPEAADLALGFIVQALDANGERITDDFAAPITLQFTVDAEFVPEGAREGEIVLAFWDGEAWIEVDAIVTIAADGSMLVTASVDHFTLFGVFHQPGRGTLDPAPVAGVSIATWGGGPLELLPPAVSYWVTADGRLTGLIPGAPEFVNIEFTALFSDGRIPAGTAMIVVR